MESLVPRPDFARPRGLLFQEVGAVLGAKVDQWFDLREKMQGLNVVNQYKFALSSKSGMD
jgi:hypothetical protein